MSISSTFNAWANSALNLLPSSSSLINTTTDLVKNVTSYPMQESLSDAQETIPFTGSIFSKISEGTKLLKDANASYAPDMLNVQTALLLTYDFISYFAFCKLFKI